jgi:hypothetical protein
MVNKSRLLLLVAGAAALVVSSSPSASADEAPPPAPAIHHAPASTVRGGEDVALSAVVDHPERLRRATLVWRSAAGDGEVAFERSSSARLPYVAIIPAASVRGPTLAYAIELETTTGEHIPAFASRAAPYPVTVLDSAEDAREAALLARLGGRRSVVQASGEYVYFGATDATVASPSGPQPRSVRDQYYRFEGSYTYRLLGQISEFGVRVGAVRGRSLVPGEVDPSKYDVGLNYGAPRVRVRATEWMHIDTELLTSVTEVGFSVGGGGALLLGDPYGSKLTLGAETIEVFGTRAYTRLDVVANQRFVVAPILEVTDMPHADRAGIRLLAEVQSDLGRGLRLDLRGGYQARTFERGGPTLGAGLAYAF